MLNVTNKSQKTKSIAFQNEIFATITELLEDYPNYGSLSISLNFHNGNLQRIVTSKEISILKGNHFGGNYE